MKKAIQFGAGNIGRGFIGAVLEKAGYHVVFADVNEQIVDRINRDKGYTVQIMDTVCEEVRITDISAVDSRSPELAQQIAEAEIVTTAVGAGGICKSVPIPKPFPLEGLSAALRQQVKACRCTFRCGGCLRISPYAMSARMRLPCFRGQDRGFVPKDRCRTAYPLLLSFDAAA